MVSYYALFFLQLLSYSRIVPNVNKGQQYLRYPDTFVSKYNLFLIWAALQIESLHRKPTLNLQTNQNPPLMLNQHLT